MEGRIKQGIIQSIFLIGRRNSGYKLTLILIYRRLGKGLIILLNYSTHILLYLEVKELEICKIYGYLIWPINSGKRSSHQRLNLAQGGFILLQELVINFLLLLVAIQNIDV